MKCSPWLKKTLRLIQLISLQAHRFYLTLQGLLLKDHQGIHNGLQEVGMHIFQHDEFLVHRSAVKGFVIYSARLNLIGFEQIFP